MIGSDAKPDYKNNMLQEIGMTVVDVWMAALPRRHPSPDELSKCKIVSHRGEHDNRSVRENTMLAFETAQSAGVWGIETDIRWTSDMVPVIHHDSDTRRVFGNSISIADTRFEELRKAVPEIPTLGELVKKFGGTIHMMLELKAEPFPQLERQRSILEEHLADLRAIDDYHILALDTELFEDFDIQPRKCCLSVAGTNFGPLSQTTLKSDYGGLTGHFLLLNNRLKKQHEQSGQVIGTGFIRSRNCLIREINRGVEWIFTNDAVRLQNALNKLLEGSSKN